jgi:phosphotransferase system enzyme I (PtsI)
MSTDDVISGQALITNPTGLHARPAVKLTKLAKSFSASLRVRVGSDGKWTDAKSVARVLALNVPKGQTLFFEAEGVDACEALSSLTELVRRDFDEASPLERQFEGRVACAGLTEGFVVLRSLPQVDGVDGPRPSDPAAERERLEGALRRAAAELERLKDAGGAVGAEIIEFQIELLRDAALVDPAFGSIAGGASASQAFRKSVETQIAEYQSSSDEYFAARASDLTDLRDRVLAALTPATPGPDDASQEDGAIYVGRDLTPSRFLEFDWSRWRGAALLGGSSADHVAILARSRGVPLLVGLRADLAELTDGEAAVLDAENGRLILSPSELTASRIQLRKRARALEADVDARYRSVPAVSASGKRITVLVNVEGEKTLESLAPDSCDGIGLTRTEFLFHDGLPDEEAQYRFYARLIAWAGGKPVTIRTLDAGGDKPIPGLTVPNEQNPFLGVRGIRLSLSNPEVFRVQLRALARAAASGSLKVMLPMVTTPTEEEGARDAAGRGGRAPRPWRYRDGPPVGIMVEVPAVAISIARFDARASAARARPSSCRTTWRWRARSKARPVAVSPVRWSWRRSSVPPRRRAPTWAPAPRWASAWHAPAGAWGSRSRVAPFPPPASRPSSSARARWSWVSASTASPGAAAWPPHPRTPSRPSCAGPSCTISRRASESRCSSS